jgi:RNA polymerase sigma-70 factor (ECF subfamily)
MVRNQALQWQRRRRLENRWCESLEDDTALSAFDTPEQVLEQAELECRMRSAIKALPERRRMAFELSRFHDLTYSEIAGVLGVSVKTVETQIGRALKTLRRCAFAAAALVLGLA